METLILNDATALEKGHDSADPCLEPQTIIATSVPWMVVTLSLVKVNNSAAYFA